MPRWAWILPGLLDAHDPTHLHRQHADSRRCLWEVLTILTDARHGGRQQRPQPHIPAQPCLLGLVAERFWDRGSYGVFTDVSGLSLLSSSSRDGCCEVRPAAFVYAHAARFFKGQFFMA